MPDHPPLRPWTLAVLLLLVAAGLIAVGWGDLALLQYLEAR